MCGMQYFGQKENAYRSAVYPRGSLLLTQETFNVPRRLFFLRLMQDSGCAKGRQDGHVGGDGDEEEYGRYSMPA